MDIIQKNIKRRIALEKYPIDNTLYTWRKQFRAKGVVERLWRSVKYEDVYLKDYETVEELIAGIREYFEFYNNERPHQTFGVMSSSVLNFP